MSSESSEERAAPTRKANTDNNERRVRLRLEGPEMASMNTEKKDNGNHDVCAICLESLSQGLRSVGAVLPCRHSYHEDCFGGWRVKYDESDSGKNKSSSFRCPTCREIVVRFVPILHSRVELPALAEEDTQDNRLYNLLHHDLWSSDAGAVEKALSELSDIVRNGEVEGVKTIDRMGGYVALIRAMERYTPIPNIQASALLILQFMVKYHADAIVRVKGAVQTIFEAMKQHPDDKFIVGVSCYVLARLVKHSKSRKAVAILVGREGGVQAAIYVSRRFPEDAQIQTSACALLAKLSNSSDELAVEIAKQGAIPLIVQAMKRHAEDSDVQRVACSLLCNLDDVEANRKLVTDSGGLQAVQDACKNHRGNRRVEEQSLKALSKLSCA